MILFWFKQKFLGVFTLTKPIGPNPNHLNEILRKFKWAYIRSFAYEFSSLKICNCLFWTRVLNTNLTLSIEKIQEGHNSSNKLANGVEAIISMGKSVEITRR